MENFLLIVLSVSLGYLIQRWKLFVPQAADALNQFVIYISLPALVLVQVPQLNFSKEMFLPAVVAYTATICNRNS